MLLGRQFASLGAGMVSGGALGWAAYLLSPGYRHRLSDNAALAGVSDADRRASVAEAGRLYMELLSLTVFIFPLGHIAGPLILWLVKKDTIPEVNEEGKRVLNFNLSWVLWTIATCGFGILAWLVIAIIATIKAANNEPFKHPWTIGFLK